MAGLKFWLVCACSLAFSAAAAADDGGVFTFGMGHAPCGEFAKAYQGDPETVELAFYSWAQGYMSGLNIVALANQGRSGTTDLGAMPVEKQRSFLRSYCDKHPLADYMQAVHELFKTMRDDQGLPEWAKKLPH